MFGAGKNTTEPSRTHSFVYDLIPPAMFPVGVVAMVDAWSNIFLKVSTLFLILLSVS